MAFQGMADPYMNDPDDWFFDTSHDAYSDPGVMTERPKLVRRHSWPVVKTDRPFVEALVSWINRHGQQWALGWSQEDIDFLNS